jgi:hypothetical protein
MGDFFRAMPLTGLLKNQALIANLALDEAKI